MKEADLKQIIDDILWMAVRYAHGRHTYAPSVVREAVLKMKVVYPGWKLKKDVTILPPEESEIHGMSFRSDYLDDLFL